MEMEEILVFQPNPLTSIEPSAPFPPASSDGLRHPSPSPAPDFAATRAVLARQNETNLQLSKAQLEFLQLVEMNEVSATITEICEFTGVSRPTFYRWRSNPRFSQAFGECIARCVFNDLSIVLRNELLDAMTGDRKAGRHTLKLFLSGRGLYHYDAILAMLNWAGRNTPIAPNAGNANGGADPDSPASTSPHASPSVVNACAGPAAPANPVASGTDPGRPVAAAPAPQPPELVTAAAPRSSRTVAPVTSAAGPAISPLAAALPEDFHPAGVADFNASAPDFRGNETFIPSSILNAENRQLTRSTLVAATAVPSVPPKCRIACLTSFALRRAGRTALHSRRQPGARSRIPHVRSQSETRAITNAAAALTFDGPYWTARYDHLRNL
jgi:hypothetical protein